MRPCSAPLCHYAPLFLCLCPSLCASCAPCALLPAAELFSFCRRSSFAASIAHTQQTHTQHTHTTHTYIQHTHSIHTHTQHTHTHKESTHNSAAGEVCPKMPAAWYNFYFSLLLLLLYLLSLPLSHSFCFVLHTFVYFSFGAGRLRWQEGAGGQHLRRIKF